MKLALFSPSVGEPRVGVVLGELVLDLRDSFEVLYEAPSPPIFEDLQLLVEAGERGLRLAELVQREALREIERGHEELKRALRKLGEVRLHLPLRPEKVLCVAVNYHSHAAEMNVKPPPRPYFFPKLPNALIGPEEPVIVPRGSSKPDHEVELAVIIGREGKYVSEARAYEHVFGYAVFNDVSLRDRQFPGAELQRFGIRWVHAKSFDAGGPLGPYIVTKDEVEDPHNLRLGLKVNEEMRQEGRTSDMIFKIHELIAEASDGITLKPGDVICTGTPSGVGAATGKFLRHGDVMEAYVEKVGVLRNPVVFEA
ncbi:MAG: fumarylacetoacetate hydrolase family protein [Acidilobaceae archaeon]|nr:fumarylacetoacetate hydrolase family protein [Acidilobaceae archaeon]